MQPEVGRAVPAVSVDEKTFMPYAKWGRRRARAGAPSIRSRGYHEYDGGRAFDTGLGHLPATYNGAAFLRHEYGGIDSAATGNGFTAG